MSAQARAVLGAIKTALQGINGSGAYAYDLSATDRVRGGVPDLGAVASFLPRAYFAMDQLRTTHGPQLGRYRRELTVLVWAFAAATSSDPEERGYVGLDLLDDICVALETDRSLGGRVLDLIVEGITVDGEEQGIPGAVIAVAQVVVYWHANSAAGV